MVATVESQLLVAIGILNTVHCSLWYIFSFEHVHQSLEVLLHNLFILYHVVSIFLVHHKKRAKAKEC